ncbi:MAG: stage III sporulation protein AA [Clostridiales bacterium]|nr:stage III sporulation protein AA [Clostridiales bacterium]
MIPAAEEMADVNLEEAREIRLRPGQPLTAVMGDRIWRGSHILTPQEIYQAAQALSGYGLAARGRELSQGFLPLPGGHRLGVCGCMGEKGIREITSLCVRIAHEIRGAGEKIFPMLEGKHALILGPPGSGKTTLLRDLIRLYGENGWQVGVADERGELAGCRDGQPMLDVGPMADVVTGLEKAKAIPLLIRSMAPQVIAMDELGDERDAQAVLEAIRCGAAVLATAHGSSRAQLKKRPGMRALVEREAFEKVVLLKGPGMPFELEEEWECN